MQIQSNSNRKFIKWHH